LKRRRLSQAAKRRCPPGRRCRVDERPTSANAGSDPRASQRRTAVERTSRSSWERITLRGAMREPWASVVARLAFAQGERTRYAHHAREDSTSRSNARTTNEVCGTVREGDSPAERRGEPLLGSVRSRSHASSEARLRGSSARAVPERGRTKAKALGRSSRPSAARGAMQLVVVPVRRRIAEVGRTPSGSEKRAIGTGRVESPHGTRSA